VLAIGGWLVDIWGPWCQDARVVVARRIDFVSEVMLDGGGECDIMVAVGGGWHWECGILVTVEGWHWYDATIDRAEALAFVPTGEGCQRNYSPPSLARSLLRCCLPASPIELMLAFS
jgi:hypothetical protein